jgi:hypothetical protein
MDPRRVRCCAIPCSASTPYHACTMRPCLVAEFLSQARFAYSRLAADQEQASMASQHILVCGLQFGEPARPPDESGSWNRLAHSVPPIIPERPNSYSH